MIVTKWILTDRPETVGYAGFHTGFESFPFQWLIKEAFSFQKPVSRRALGAGKVYSAWWGLLLLFLWTLATWCMLSSIGVVLFGQILKFLSLFFLARRCYCFPNWHWFREWVGLVLFYRFHGKLSSGPGCGQCPQSFSQDPTSIRIKSGILLPMF